MMASLLILTACGEQSPQVVGIESIEYDANGDLVILFTDGTIQIVSIPEKEVSHNFSEWKKYDCGGDLPCNSYLYYHTCKDCAHIEWREGRDDDHSYVYASDDIHHWEECELCHQALEKVEHTIDNTGFCSGCNSFVETKGIAYELSADGTYAKVVGYEGEATQIVIAESYMDVPVTIIGEHAFISNENITKVVIPNSITTIAEGAFVNCTKLNAVSIPESVTSIEAVAFGRCTSLESIYIPESVTSLGMGVFAMCNSLSEITVDENNQNYQSINGIVFSKDGTELVQYAPGIKDHAFAIPDGVTTINSGAFAYCLNLSSIVIPSSVTSIGESAFEECVKLIEVINHSELNITADSADYGCVGEFALTIHNGESSKLDKVGDYIFYVHNGENYLVNYVGDDAEITIPANYNSQNYAIKDYAFVYCDTISDITIPNSVTSIGTFAFAYCSNLTSVTIPDSVTSIADFAFSDCYSLVSVTIPDSVTSIGDYAFDSCSSLVSVTIPNSVESIGNSAFSWCSSLESVTIPDSVTSIGSDAFEYCSSLESVVIPDSVTSIGDWAFCGCSSLVSVVIGDSVTSIGYYAFYSCGSLTEVYYNGSAEEWNSISIGYSNDYLKNATRYYYSESHPTEEGNFWHWVDGEPTAWCNNLEILEAVAPTCSETGLTRGMRCLTCGYEVEQSVIPASEHSVILYTTTNSESYPFAISGNLITSTNHTNSSRSTFTITASKAMVMELEYLVSSESNYDWLIITHNSQQLVMVSGTSVTSYTALSVNMAAGDTVTITYSKDGSSSNGSDCAYIRILSDNLVYLTEENLSMFESYDEDIHCDICGSLVVDKTAHGEIISEE